jgi:hypothetical protein
MLIALRPQHRNLEDQTFAFSNPTLDSIPNPDKRDFSQYPLKGRKVIIKERILKAV